MRRELTLTLDAKPTRHVKDSIEASGRCAEWYGDFYLIINRDLYRATGVGDVDVRIMANGSRYDRVAVVGKSLWLATTKRGGERQYLRATL